MGHGDKAKSYQKGTGKDRIPYKWRLHDMLNLAHIKINQDKRDIKCHG
jgi:hypothetical protein